MTIEPEALKLSFQLTARGDHLEVRATALKGEGRIQTALPSPALLSQLAEFDPVHMPLAALQSAGQSLYHCLVVGDVAKLAADVLLEARSARQPAQFELRFDPDQVALAQHPWEIIADDLGQFLVREGLVDVTRYITYPQPPPALSMAFQDRALLRVVCQPQDLPLLTINELPLSCQTLAHATFQSLSEKLLIERVALWGLQFDGHGALVQRCSRCDTINMLDATMCAACGARLSGASQVGVLAFESNGSIEWVPAQEFGSILYNAQVQLAMLLACETARLGEQWMFSGLAPSLVLAGVPAVVGMQYPVSDRFANSFASSFYRALVRQNDVLAALRIARQMNAQAAWYSPVLYLRHRKTTPADEVIRPTFHTRNVDTAVPAQTRAGSTFLVRLWIRRPQTKPLTTEQLRDELNVPASVPIATRESEAEIRFEPIPIEQRPREEKRKLRRGEVEVKLAGVNCRVTPDSIKLFVDEDLDAPPAIFTVRAQDVGGLSLIFSLWQDGGQIASVTHLVEVTRESAQTAVKTRTDPVPVDDVQPTRTDSTVPTDRLVGKTLGQYRIIEVIGQGAMGTVYKAYQSVLDRHVALKVLPDYLAADDDFVAHFRQEALAAAALRHPNILVIHDVGQEGDTHYIAMEYLEGQTLSDVLRRTGGLTLQQAARILDQIASALDFAHRRGLVHRDIKPANIFIGHDDHVTLMDFGIVKAMSGASVTRTGMLVGAPEYMSPEQIDGRPVDQLSDVYSLGVVLYQMLTGQVPFTGDTPSAIMYAHVNKPPTPPSKLTAFVTPEVETVVLRALAKNPQERFNSVRGMAQAFSQAVAGHRPAPGGPAVAMPVPPLPKTVAAPSKAAPSLRPLWPIIAILGALALIVGAVIVAMTTSVLRGRGGLSTGFLTSTATSVLVPSATFMPVPSTDTPTPPPTSTPTSMPTQAATLTPRPTAKTAPRGAATVANEPRTVTLYSPVNGMQFKSSVITFKWSGGALQNGETFVVEITPRQANKGKCMEDYGSAGINTSGPLTEHEWTTDITNMPQGKAKPCAGSIEWRVHVRDANGNVIQSTPLSYFEWNPL